MVGLSNGSEAAAGNRSNDDAQAPKEDAGSAFPSPPPPPLDQSDPYSSRDTAQGEAELPAAPGVAKALATGRDRKGGEERGVTDATDRKERKSREVSSAGGGGEDGEGGEGSGGGDGGGGGGDGGRSAFSVGKGGRAGGTTEGKRVAGEDLDEMRRLCSMLDVSLRASRREALTARRERDAAEGVVREQKEALASLRERVSDLEASLAREQKAGKVEYSCCCCCCWWWCWCWCWCCWLCRWWFRWRYFVAVVAHILLSAMVYSLVTRQAPTTLMWKNTLGNIIDIHLHASKSNRTARTRYKCECS